MILLFLLPFYDRGPERRPERRPIATLTAIFIIGAMAYLTYLGAAAGPPTQIDMPTPAPCIAEGPKVVAQYESGRQVVAQSGCLACHKIGENGNDGPGPELTDIGDRLPAAGDRAHADQPDGADAVVREPAEERAGEVRGPRDVPRRLKWTTAMMSATGSGSAGRPRLPPPIAARCPSRRSGRCSIASRGSTTS